MATRKTKPPVDHAAEPEGIGGSEPVPQTPVPTRVKAGKVNSKTPGTLAVSLKGLPPFEAPDTAGLSPALAKLADNPRVTIRRPGAPSPEGKCVVYWMQRARSAAVDNHARRICAVAIANES